MLNWFKQLHYFFVRQGFYPVLLTTILAGLLFIGRVYLSGTWTYRFLLWNLFLAWIPYLCSLSVLYLYQHGPPYRSYLLLPSFIWLLFFPNAPYLVTDLIHLQPRHPVPFWYDIGLLVVLAWNGLFLAVFSLQSIQIMVKQLMGTILSWFFVFNIMRLTGLGIYLGRFLRWNSWDIFFHPQRIVMDIARPLFDPFSHLQTYGFTFMFAAFLFVCYLTLTTTKPSPR
ncbi:MAG: DUF1361 domain-containing protein [Chloroflexota bacterium]